MVTEACFRHPERASVEHCEICRRAVCGLCLWYAESGERLCPEHAAEFQQAGKKVIPPDRYAAGIALSEASAARPAQPPVPYQGNSVDVTALIAAVMGSLTLAWCAGIAWIIPLLAFIFGLTGWLQAKSASDPRRTRWLSGIGMASGGLFLGISVFGFLIFFLCFFSFFAASGLLGPGLRSTPIPLATITP
jgi:hypothetical protein